MSGILNLLLSSSARVPVVSQNFLTTPTLPAWLDVSGITGNRMVYDSTGTLTWAPNNQYINSNSATNTARTITTAVGINYYIWVQTSSGSATVVASGTNTTTFNGSAGGTFTAFTATAGTLTLTPTSNFANITQVVVAQITYESALRSVDNVVTGAAAYYGPRFDYPNAVAAGLLIEESRTNVALWSRDLTNAAWTKTNVTAALNQTGVDTVANSASSITATAGNGTVLQAITLGSSQRFQTAFVKRISGTGTVNMTTDGGATWTAITVTGSWARVSIPAQTVTNPSIGFQIVTNGDAIAVDYVQNETGPSATSPVPTTSASVTRVADVIKLAGSALTTMQGAAGSAVVEFFAQPVGSSAGLLAGTSIYPLYLSETNASTWNGSTGVQTANTTTASAANRAAVGWDSSPARSIVMNAGTVATDANSFGSPGATINMGFYGQNNLNSWVRGLSIYNSKLPDATLQSKSTVGGGL